MAADSMDWKKAAEIAEELNKKLIATIIGIRMIAHAHDSAIPTPYTEGWRDLCRQIDVHTQAVAIHMQTMYGQYLANEKVNGDT